MYVTLYRRTPGFSELAEAELEALVGGHSPEAGVWLSEAPVRWAETGFGKAGGRHLASGATLDELRDELLALRLESPRIGLTPWRIPKYAKGATAAKTLVADCIDGDVDFADPTLRLGVLISPLGYRVFEDGEPGDGSWVATRHKPHNLMVGLPTRLARSMLNLTARPGDRVLDPFCGAGTIPLLAAWAGLDAAGSDISWQALEQAEANAAHFGQKVALSRADARTSRQRADCIVSNLPYGVYCHLAEETRAAVLGNLGRMAPRVTLVTSEPLRDAMRSVGFDVQRVVTVESERFQRFVYLARSPR